MSLLLVSNIKVSISVIVKYYENMIKALSKNKEALSDRNLVSKRQSSFYVIKDLLSDLL